jgi:hypothetical protein
MMSYPDFTPRQYGGLYLWTDLDNKLPRWAKRRAAKALLLIEKL